MTAVAKGCDWGWGFPDPAALEAQGIRFAGRYVTRDRTGKALTLAQAVALSAHGVRVVNIFEDAAGRALTGTINGVADAQFASKFLRQVKCPPGQDIYVAVDVDTGGKPERVAPYFEGWQRYFPKSRIRAYGSHEVVEWAAANGYGPGMQTTAWSHGLWSDRIAIRQTGEQSKIGSVPIDLDDAVMADYGGWSLPEHGGITIAEWRGVKAFIHAHFGHALWSHVWTVLTSHPAEVRKLIDAGKIKPA